MSYNSGWSGRFNFRGTKGNVSAPPPPPRTTNQMLMHFNLNLMRTERIRWQLEIWTNFHVLFWEPKRKIRRLICASQRHRCLWVHTLRAHPTSQSLQVHPCCHRRRRRQNDKLSAKREFAIFSLASCKTKWNYVHSPRQTNMILIMVIWMLSERMSHNYLHKHPMWTQPKDQKPNHLHRYCALSRAAVRRPPMQIRFSDAKQTKVVHELIFIVGLST